MAVLLLIHKRTKDYRYLKYWRLDLLVAIDYKMRAKTLGTRLQKIIRMLISPDQEGYIKGGYIGQNVRTIEDL